jgi:cell shape-determining protein MreC
MRRKRNFFIWIIAFFCFFIFLNKFTSASDIIRGSSLSLTSSIQTIILDKGNKFFSKIEILQDIEKIRVEIKRLREDNTRLNSKISSFLYLKEENQALRDILEVDLVENDELVFSQIIGKDLLINEIIIKHDREIEIGLPVITPQGVLIGVITEKHKNKIAKVGLITNIESVFEVKVQNEESPIGILRGGGKKNLLLDLLPKDKIINEGDFVVIVPNDDGINKEFYIGKVFEIEESDVEAFKKAKVWQGVDYRYLTHLFIVR